METPDLESSSADYARRFSGATGRWFLEVQERATLDALDGISGAKIVDVGGGHGQTARALSARGHQVTVVGSSAHCPDPIRRDVDSGDVRYVHGELTRLPFEDAEFDVGISYRILPHLRDWAGLIAELARVSRRRVIVDFPTIRSVNAFSAALYPLKKRVEGNTRPFRLFREHEVVASLDRLEFEPAGRHPQFFFPMALHRACRTVALSRLVEALASGVALTRLFGSPIILSFKRRGAAR